MFIKDKNVLTYIETATGLKGWLLVSDNGAEWLITKTNNKINV